MSIEDMNYYSDRRVRAAERGDWYTSLNAGRLIATVRLWGDGDEDTDEEEVEVPIKFEVCDTCEGKGRHVNPSIDAGGLSREDFEQDPDFMEGYMRGDYDVTCAECHGERVVPELDRKRCDPAILKRLEAKWEEERQSRRERDAERRFGA